MSYSYTEKKRIRKDFGKLPEVWEMPDLLQVQKESYARFLQAGVAGDQLIDEGIQAVLQQIFPIDREPLQDGQAELPEL